MQLEEIREQRGEGAEHIVPDKPLTQVLAEAKEAHEAKFQAVWKSMKTGESSVLQASIVLHCTPACACLAQCTVLMCVGCYSAGCQCACQAILKST